MSQSPILLHEFIKTLQQQNKSKIHEIFSLNSQLNQVISFNQELKQQEQRLILVHTEQRVIIQRQDLEIMRLNDVIREIEGELERKVEENEGLRVEFDEAVKRLMDAEYKESIREFGYQVSVQRENGEKEYEMLSTKNYFDNVEIKQIEEGQNKEYERGKGEREEKQKLELSQKLQECQCTIINLSEQIRCLEEELSASKTQKNENHRKYSAETQKWEINCEQMESKLRHTEQSLELSQTRNQSLSKQIKQLVEVRYNLQIRNNSLNMNNQGISKLLLQYKIKNQQLTTQLKQTQEKLALQSQQTQTSNHTIQQLSNQISSLKHHNKSLQSSQHDLKHQLHLISHSTISIQQYNTLKQQYQSFRVSHQRLIQEHELKQSQLLSKVEQYSQIEIKEQDETRMKREEVSHLIAINHTLSNQLNLVRQRLMEEEMKGREILRLEKANRSLMHRVESLQTSINEKRRNSSTKIDSLLHIPSIQTIPSMNHIHSSQEKINNNRYNLLRMKSQENLYQKGWSRELESREIKEIKGSSRVKNVFSSRLDVEAVEKMKWRNLQDRIESLKYQNLDLKKHMQTNKL